MRQKRYERRDCWKGDCLFTTAFFSGSCPLLLTVHIYTLKLILQPHFWRLDWKRCTFTSWRSDVILKLGQQPVEWYLRCVGVLPLWRACGKTEPFFLKLFSFSWNFYWVCMTDVCSRLQVELLSCWNACSFLLCTSRASSHATLFAAFHG